MDGTRLLVSYYHMLRFPDNGQVMICPSEPKTVDLLRDQAKRLHRIFDAKAYFMYWVGFDSYRYNGFHSWTMDRNGYVLNGGWGNTAGCVGS